MEIRPEEELFARSLAGPSAGLFEHEELLGRAQGQVSLRLVACRLPGAGDQGVLPEDMRLHCRQLSFALPAGGLGLLLALTADCAGAPSPAVQEDPTLQAMGSILQDEARERRHRPGCRRRKPSDASCHSASRRIFPLTLALDPRYRSWPSWRERLTDTMACVNALYRGTRIGFRLARIASWDPGLHRHQLYPLLHRLRHEVRSEAASLRLGITVWDAEHIYRMAGGEIGLSQAGACVVPSWPRAENDCVILAHELGHLVGAQHLGGKHWVMGWSAHPFHLPAADPLARVTQTYRFHPDNIAMIDLHSTARVGGAGLELPLPCKESLAMRSACAR